MKPLLTLLLFSHLTGFTQQSQVELHAYQQKVIPGMAPARDVEEGGKVIRKTPGQEVQYYIFLAVPDSIAVYPISLWIKGKEFGVMAKEAATSIKLLAAQDSSAAPSPTKKQRVLRLFPLPAASGKQPRGAVLAKENELVLAYKMRGKFYFLTKEVIERMDPVNLP